MEREPTPEGTAVHRIVHQRTLNGLLLQQQFADRATGSDADPAGSDPMTGELRREHWIVPVRGLTRADPDGVVQAIAHCDGTVILHLTCGDSQTRMRLDVCRAAQLSTGIWEAAGASQQLIGYPGEDQPAPPQPPHAPGDLPVPGRSHTHRSAPLRNGSPRRRRRSATVNKGAAMDATRTIGLRIRLIRQARDKSLRVIAGLAGMSASTLPRIERGQRELTLSEIVALASALEIAPATLIRLPILAPANGHTDAERSVQSRTP